MTIFELRREKREARSLRLSLALKFAGNVSSYDKAVGTSGENKKKGSLR